MSDPMKRWTDYGKTPGGLRHFAKQVDFNPAVRCGYAIHVLESAADEIERLQDQVTQLVAVIEQSKQLPLL